MNLQFINWKVYLDNPAEAEPDEFFKVFSDWIPDSPEIFIDVADYQHVHDGPVTVLVGHFLNVSLDSTGRRLGLLYDYKQPMDGSNEDKLRSSLLGLLRMAKRLQEDAGFSRKPRFRAGDLALTVNSRALAPNTQETLAVVKPDLTKVLAKAFGSGDFSLDQAADPRQRFSLGVAAKQPQDIDAVLHRLA